MEQKNTTSSADEGPSGKMKDWSVDQVCQWLAHLQCDHEVIDEFQRHKISGFALSRLEEKHLEKMQYVMIGDQVTIISKRNEVLEKEALEANQSRTVFKNPAEETNKPQEGTTKLEFAKVTNNQNDMDQLHSSFPPKTQETKLNISISLPISADITEASYQTQTSLHEAGEMKQNQKDMEEESNLSTFDSEMFQIPAVSCATEFVPDNRGSVDNMPSKVIETSDSKKHLILSESVSSDQFRNSCEHSLGLQEHVSESNTALILESSSPTPLFSVNSDFAMEKSVTKQFLDKHMLPESLASLASKSIPEFSTMSKKLTLTPNKSGSEVVELEQVLECKEHGAVCIEKPELSSKAGTEAEGEQSMQLASRSGTELTSRYETEFTSRSETEFTSRSETEFTSRSETEFASRSETEFTSRSGTEFASRLDVESLGSNQKVPQCGQLTSLLKGVQMVSEKVSDIQDTESNHEVTDIMEPKVLDMKQMNTKSGMSNYEASTEIHNVDGNTNLTGEQNLCPSASHESNVYDKNATCELGETLSDSDKVSKDDEKQSECDQKQMLESRVHAPETVSDECPGSSLVSSGDIPTGSSRRFKSVKELLEYKKQQKQQQSAQSHLNPSSCSKPFPTPEKEYLIPQLSEKSNQSVSSLQMLLSNDKSMLSQLTQKNKTPCMGEGTSNTKGTDLFKDLYLGIKAQNVPNLAERKQSVSEVHVTCTLTKAEITVEPDKITETVDSRKSVEALDSRKIASQFVEPHCYTTKAVQSADTVQLSTTADTSTLTKEQMGPECTYRPVPVQSARSTAKKEPFSMEKLPKRISTSSTKTAVTSHPAPISAAVGDQKKNSVKLIGKNAPQNESKAKFLRNTLALAEQNVIKADQLPAEVLRKIGSRTDRTFKYRQGAKISACERSSGRNLLYPVHRFALFESLKDVTALTEFCKEVIQFACACLNDRTNGIIHFGIESGSRNSIAVYGKIVGVALIKETKDYGDFLRKAIRKCFNEAQAEVALQCIKGPEFIETVPNDLQVPGQPKLFVIEVDVIPEHAICKEEIFCVKLPTKQKGCFEPESIFRIIDAAPCKLDPCDPDQFRMKVCLLASERKELEDQSKRKQKIENDLSKKFIHLFCHGSENLLGDHYHILVVNKPDGHMDREYMKTALSFIAEIEWKVVFDFDAEASLCNFVQEQEKPIKIKMTDDFYHRSKYNIQEPDRLKQMLDDLKNSDCPTWVFANGYQPQNEEPQPTRKWKKNRAEGFKYAARFFRDQIPEGRATVLFLLLSKETDVMLSAADELMTIFYNQWMCVSESEDIGKPWIDELVRRDSTEPENAESNVVWGMPWKHVQGTVARLLGPKKYSICELPTSTGAYIPVNNTMNNELTDLEILGSFECDNAEIQYDEELLRLHKKKVEEEFYKGDCVSWWNFWSHHVCGRDILESAKRNVQSALIYEDDTVGKVFLYHQPGAGATTLAKNILWDFRKEYRCAVVRKISGGQTAGQVLKLFWYEDRYPKPVLLLLDNPDADKLNLLYADLSEMTRCIIKSSDEVPRVVCVLLVCSRQSQLRTPVVDSDSKRLLLKHELSRRELNWFQDRYKYLSAEFANVNSDIRPPNAVHPRLLISFNVMKENFNLEYIRRTVRELIQAITDAKEQKLLKYVSLLNTFDLECRPIPTSSLDGMMLEFPWSNQGGLRYGLKAKSNRWETKLSAEVRVLLNETSETALGKIHSLRIANPLLSREILNVLRNNGSVPVGDIALEFLRNKEIFKSLCLPRDNLVNIIKDVLKRRQQKGGKPETAFSPLIQHIVDHESIDTAVDVMKEVLALTSDPYIDQQLARLYIKAQNWQMATEFAKKATDQRPENSFFWDTYGRIYERQLVEEYEKLAKDTIPHDINDLIHVIRIALDGMQMFRKVQVTSEQEKTTILANKAGFFGELQMVVCLLDCLTYVFRDKDELRAFILTELVPAECRMLGDINGRNYLEELKTLEKHVQEAMNRLEDELVQLRDDTLYEYQRTKYSKYEIDSLQRLKENLDNYFGEEGDNPPESLNEKDQCEFRRRRVFRLASHNIGSIFDLRWKYKGDESLVRIRRIALQNLETPHANAEDYLAAISVTLALTSMDVSSLYDVGIKFDDMVEWSTKLYIRRESSIVIHLESYLFYVMFNWPRKNTKHSVVPKRLETALKQWKDAYYTKYPRQRDEGKPYRKKDTTMFFLANGSDMASIYTTFEERGSRRINENRGRDSFWKLPDTLRKLQRFEGFLSRDGNEVSVNLHYPHGNKELITIPTSFPIQNRNMWNKKVYFVIGFSWNGPRAFDVSLNDPTLQADMARDHTLNRNVSYNVTYAPSRRPIPDFTQEDFCRKFSEIMAQLEKIHRIEEISKNSGYILKPDELQLLGKKKKLEENRDHLLQDRRRGMESRIPDFTVAN